MNFQQGRGQIGFRLSWIAPLVLHGAQWRELKAGRAGEAGVHGGKDELRTSSTEALSPRSPPTASAQFEKAPRRAKQSEQK